MNTFESSRRDRRRRFLDAWAGTAYHANRPNYKEGSQSDPFMWDFQENPMQPGQAGNCKDRVVSLAEEIADMLIQSELTDVRDFYLERNVNLLIAG